MSTPQEESLEKIFQKVEEESERRAQDEMSRSNSINPSDEFEASSGTTSSDTATRSARTRRRGSVSITYFGMPTEDQSGKGVSVPSTPNGTGVTSLGSQAAFYQAEIKNLSKQSLASELSDDDAHAEDLHQVTQIHQIASRRATLTKAVNGLIPRRLSRAQSANVLAVGGASVIVGISVQEATVDGPPESTAASTVIQASGPRIRPSQSNSNMSPSLSSTWVTRAKGFTQKFRRKRSNSEAVVIPP